MEAMEVEHPEQNWDTGMAGSSLVSFSEDMLCGLFQLLPACDRLQLAACCSRLLDFVETPAAWRGLIFVLNKDSDSVNSLSDLDQVLIRKYGKYIKRAKIVMNLREIAVSTSQLLQRVLLCRRGAIQRVTMYIDKPVRVTKTVHASPFSTERTVYTLTGSFHLMLVRALAHPAYHTTSAFLNKLAPGTAIAINFCGQHRNKEAMNADRDCETGHTFLTTADYRSMSEQSCSNVRKLVLPASQLSELQLDEISKTRICNVGRRRGHCLTPTARLIAKFSNLRELYIGHENVSNQLLLQVSKQTSLCRLVIRYYHPSPTPQLSPATWDILAKACSSLSVECDVHLPTLPPQLDNMIRPETPLAKVKIICQNCHEDGLLKLFSLCQVHARTLQKFTLIVNGNSGPQLLDKNVEVGLKKMVDACTRLQYVVCNVDILDECVLRLARLDRTHKTFRFNLSRVLTCKDGEMAACDGGKDGCDGSTTPLRRLDEGRELQELKMQLTDALGFFDDWKDSFKDLDL